MASLSLVRLSDLERAGEGDAVALLKRDVGVSDLRGGGVGGVAALNRGGGEGATLWGESVLFVD